MKKKINVFLFFLFFVVGTINIVAQDDIPNAPSPSKLYVNLSKRFPDFLSSEQANQLEKDLRNFEKETSNEIVVVIIDDLNGYEKADYAIKLGAKWKIGKEKEDNGIVILIKPTEINGKRTSFIATGKGLEGAIPDITCKRIVEKELNPNLKDNKNYEGITASLVILKKLAKGEFNHKEYSKKEKSANSLSEIIFQFLFVAGLVIYIIGWLFYGIDPKKGKIEIQQDPPSDLSPALVCALVNQEYKGKEIFKNALFSLASKELIRIKYNKLTNNEVELLREKEEIEKLIENHEAANISKEEIIILNSLFIERSNSNDLPNSHKLHSTFAKQNNTNCYALPNTYNWKFSAFIEELGKDVETKNKNLFFKQNIGFWAIGMLTHLISVYFFFDTYNLGWTVLYIIALIILFVIMVKLIHKYTKLGREKMDKIDGFIRFIKSTDYESIYNSKTLDNISINQYFSYAYSVNQIGNWKNHFRYLNQLDNIKFNLSCIITENEEITDENLTTILDSLDKDITESITKNKNSSTNSIVAGSTFMSSSDNSSSDNSSSDFGGGDFGGGGAGGDW
jgi:uncharacterized protein